MTTKKIPPKNLNDILAEQIKCPALETDKRTCYLRDKPCGHLGTAMNGCEDYCVFLINRTYHDKRTGEIPL